MSIRHGLSDFLLPNCCHAESHGYGSIQLDRGDIPVQFLDQFPDFDIVFAIIGVAQFQHLFFRLLLRPVVKTHTDGPGDRLERTAVLIIIARGDETY